MLPSFIEVSDSLTDSVSKASDEPKSESSNSEPSDFDGKTHYMLTNLSKQQ